MTAQRSDPMTPKANDVQRQLNLHALCLFFCNRPRSTDKGPMVIEVTDPRYEDPAPRRLSMNLLQGVLPGRGRY